MQMSANGWQPWNANGRPSKRRLGIPTKATGFRILYMRRCSSTAVWLHLQLLSSLPLPLSKVCNILPSSPAAAVTMADPLYSRSQMSTVAAAAVAVSGCSAERERQFQKGLWLPDVQPILVQRERVVRHTRRRRHESRRQNGAAVARESAMAGKLKGPRRSSICEGCNGVLTGLAAVRTASGVLSRREEKRGEESKSGGYLLSQQEGRIGGGRPSIARETDLRLRPSFKPIPGSNLLFQFRLPIALPGGSVAPTHPLSTLSFAHLLDLPSSPFSFSLSLSLWISHIIYFYTKRASERSRRRRRRRHSEK